MEDNVVSAVTLAGSVSGDLSVWSLFARADWIVKVVMIVLIVASVWCWAIIFEKSTNFRRLKRQADNFEESFWSGGSLDDLYDRVGAHPESPLAMVFSAAMTEWRRALARGLQARDERATASLAQRIDRVMQVTAAREVERLERYMGFLATVGSTAPFVGLFGTVWGIMNSFQSIALTKNTSLTVVAPGIAEALFATALGLVAAIPAVVAYNKLSADLGNYVARMETFATEFSSVLSRQLEERRV